MCCVSRRFTDYHDVVPDHIAPKGMGGAWRDDHPDNIQAVHWWCNSEKGLPETWSVVPLLPDWKSSLNSTFAVRRTCTVFLDKDPICPGVSGASRARQRHRDSGPGEQPTLGPMPRHRRVSELERVPSGEHGLRLLRSPGRKGGSRDNTKYGCFSQYTYVAERIIII